ncbi:pentapeptide repeat-containing protein [Pantoea sp. 1.19]|uniref:pentapeptide repeat-containing protein n=1 Tax=Pantoea sp. 1.19 TaxID=1925589 RepID=UPI000949135E|nr:pentapeptide repeat-containing protein [Pantoea sp. 1.19]
MNATELNRILYEHHQWVQSEGKSGKCANLRRANLRDADLIGANLRDADLRGSSLPEKTFVMVGEDYFLQITNGECVRVGCQQHTVEQWRKFSRLEIAKMDGAKALKFYPRLLDIIDFYLGKGERPGWVKLTDEVEDGTI